MLVFIILLQDSIDLLMVRPVRVMPMQEWIEWAWRVFQVLTWRNFLNAACPLDSWMVAKEACHQILNCHLDDYFNCWLSSSDHHRDSHCGQIISFSWCCTEQEEQEKCSAFASRHRKVSSHRYEKINRATHRNVHKSMVNKLQIFAKDTRS